MFPKTRSDQQLQESRLYETAYDEFRIDVSTLEGTVLCVKGKER